MTTTDGNPQPHQAPPPPAHRHRGLKPAPRRSRRPNRANRSTPALTAGRVARRPRAKGAVRRRPCGIATPRGCPEIRPISSLTGQPPTISIVRASPVARLPSPRSKRARPALGTPAFVRVLARPALLQRHALSGLAARGGRLHRPDDARAERREADVRRRAAAFLGHPTAGSPTNPIAPAPRPWRSLRHLCSLAACHGTARGSGGVRCPDEDRCRSSVRTWAYHVMAGCRAGGHGMRAARAGALRCSQPQDNCHGARRRVAVRDRGGPRALANLCGLGGERAGGCGSPPGSAVCRAQLDGRPSRGLGDSVARRGEALGRLLPVRSRRERTVTASTPTPP